MPSCPNSTTVVYASNLLFFWGAQHLFIIEGKVNLRKWVSFLPPPLLCLYLAIGFRESRERYSSLLSARRSVYNMYWMCHSRASLSYAESFGQTGIHLYTSHFSPPTSHTPTNATYTPIDRYFETVRRRHAIKYQHICLLSSLVHGVAARTQSRPN